MISHRAELARFLVFHAELGMRPGDTSVAWAPFFHMAATEPAPATLVGGGKVIVVDGFRPDEIALHAGREALGYLLLMPGMIDPFIGEMKKHAIRPAGVRLCGAMNVIAMSEVPPGTPGELAFRGPTLFSGYWNAPETNARDFRGGWFHLGDMFVRNTDGTLDFVDRLKYLIKSGGENIYPAEIERVLLADPAVADAVVVRRPDPTWGEVPVAVVARKDETLTDAQLRARRRTELAGYKQPKDFVFVALAELPRSTTGKIQRHEVEARLRNRGAATEPTKAR